MKHDIIEGRRGSKPENSPVRSTQLTSSGSRSGSTPTRGRGKVTKSQSSPIVTKAGEKPVTGPGRTPQTKRRELTTVTNITAQLDKSSPSGSPRNVNRTSCGSGSSRKPGSIRSKNEQNRDVNSNNEETTRKTLSLHDSKSTRTKSSGNISKSLRNSASARHISPERNNVDDLSSEVSSRKRFEELCDIKNIEMGMVKVPPEILEDLINKENIEDHYDVDELPVASGLFATVRKCTHKESGVEYAAKYSSRLRYGVDCTTEVLHEIALLSICAESNKIVHLKDVFQNKHEIILVLEYAPGGDFQTVLDDDMVPFEQDVQGFMLQLLEALSFAHDRNIAHLDIKPQNIVLMSEFPNCEIKLCDLEVSRVIQEHEEIREIIGTPDYVAPEILAYEPISLSADIWSLGVLAYVLLTGFSPFGGESDQETLRNITSAPLDFPSELFEGVSDDAKEFIKMCLNRNPSKRPSVEQCQKHSWIAQESEPPSPSPLMLKIPAPDHFVTSPKLSVHSLHSPSGSSHSSSRRSCQTCRDKLSERKRYLSKSREAIFEKVTNSNLKKSLSKSRERLCDMRFTLGKSREYLNESKQVSRSQEKFYNFKSISKSQEVLSQCLGGNMKRINGAVSDISPHHLPTNPRIYIESSDQESDFVMLPGSSVLMSHSELLAITGPGLRNAGSLQLLPITESGRSTPASVCSNATVADIPYSGSSVEPCNETPVPVLTGNNNAKKSVVGDTLVEISEEECDDDDNKSKNNKKYDIKSIYKDSNRKGRYDAAKNQRACSIKEEKNNINYETKQNMNKSGRNNNNTTSEVAIQVDDKELTNNTFAPKSNSALRRKESPDSNQHHQKRNIETQIQSLSGASLSFPALSPAMQADGNIRPATTSGGQEKKLTRGFSHDNTLGGEQKRYSWREDLEKFRSMKKPLAVSDLIDAFSSNTMQRKVSSNDSLFPDIDGIKSKRRGSLQIHLDPKSMENLSKASEISDSALKALRRKSTSAILPMRMTEAKMVYQESENEKVVINEKSNKSSKPTSVQCDKPTSSTSKEATKPNDKEAVKSNDTSSKETVIKESDSVKANRRAFHSLNERKRTWDYFEINHPKAISDKKLEQLKAKYNRRKTEANILSKSNKENETVETNNNSVAPHIPPSPIRTHSMPVFDGLVGSPLPKKPLDLAFDPLTGECLSSIADTESVDSGRESEVIRKFSSDSCDDSSWKTDPERVNHGYNGVCKQEIEQLIPEQCVLECFIDPFTGQFITNEVAKTDENDSSEKKQSTTSADNRTKNNNLKVVVDKRLSSDSNQNNNIDDGIGSLPITPTDLGRNKNLSLLKPSLDVDENILGSGSEESVVIDIAPSNNFSTNINGGRLNQESDICLGSVSRGLEMFKDKEKN